MGGNALLGVRPITHSEFVELWGSLVSVLTAAGARSLIPIGSTGIRHVINDVDVAGWTAFDREPIVRNLLTIMPKCGATALGAANVSFRFPIHGDPLKDPALGESVQVDLTLGDVTYLVWSRCGSSDNLNPYLTSEFKGSLRNVMLNTVARCARPSKVCDLDRERFIIDFDKGLYWVTQTKRPRSPSTARPLKDWRTIDSKFVSHDPKTIVRTLFCNNTDVRSTYTVERLALAVLRTTNPSIGIHVLEAFYKDLQKLTDKRVLGDDPDKTLAAVRRVLCMS